MKLSVIIPVYNVEQYIRSCVQSIYRQGLSEEDFEVILVNDGTKDNSFSVIKDIIANHKNIIVLEQSNQGLSAARNTGMKRANGDYILFIDSDDLLINNSLCKLVNQLSGNPVDLLIAGFVKMTNQEISANSIEPKVDTPVIKSGKEVFLENLDPRQCYVWRTIYRRDFLEQNMISFVPGIYFEDVPFTTECYLKAEKCIVTTTVFYIYRQRQDSIVSSINMKKVIDMNKVVENLWHMKKNTVLPLEIGKKLEEVIFVTFSIAIWYVTHDSKLYSELKAFVTDLKVRIPDLSFSGSLKQRIVSFLFKFAPLSYIKFLSFIYFLEHKFS